MSKENEWLKLDNVAKVFPSIANKKDPKVFRFVCALKEEINKELLEQATLKALEMFPMYKSVLKRGIFWYYLEQSEIEVVVEEENKPACYPIYENSEGLLFRVNYFKKRINLEVFHVLSDGVGASEFFKSLIANYLKLSHKELEKTNINLEYRASLKEKVDDSFSKYYDSKGKKKSIKIKRVHHIKGLRLPESRIQVIEGHVSTKELIELSHKYNTTITVLLLAIYFYSIHQEMSVREKKKPVVITIPVNMRQYFKSLSVRNFFGVFNVGYDFKNNSSELRDIIDYLKVFFDEKLNYDEMSAILNSYMSLENNILVRSIPLFFKDKVLKFSNYLTNKTVTTLLSNVGKISMPKELEKYIDYFSVFTSANGVQITIASYLDNMVISFSSILKNTNIQKNFYSKLSELGINVKVISNIVEGEDNE